MNNDELKSLLKFITSSSRAPLLGFKDLNPLICIKKTTDNELDRLPTSSTCINLLKLTDYQSKSVLRKKLFQAMEQGTTFELS
jgi:ubiquitin-protein ligase E3 C